MFTRLSIMKRCGLLLLSGCGSSCGRISRFEMQHAIQMVSTTKVYERAFSSTKRKAAKEKKEEEEGEAHAALGTSKQSNNKVGGKTKSKNKAVGKALIIESVKRDTFLKRELVEKVFESFFRNVKQDIAKGTVVGLNNFGTFYLKVLKSRKSCHPKTGEVINILEKRKMAFTHEIVDLKQLRSNSPAAASDAASRAKIEDKENNDEHSESSDSEEDTDDDSDDDEVDDDEEDEKAEKEKKTIEKK